MDTVDVIVVGAGIGGLCAAKTYLELAPDTRLLILEAARRLKLLVLDAKH